MRKLDPTVRKETLYAVVWILALSLLMEGIVLIAGQWSVSVLVGNLAGAAAAAGNYLLLGITVARAAAGPADKVALRVRSSMTMRMLGQAAVCALAVWLLHANVYTTILPLLFPRIGITFRPTVDRLRGVTDEAESESGEGSDLLD